MTRRVLEFVGNTQLFPEGAMRSDLKGLGIAERTMDRYLEDLVLLGLLKREETSESRGENVPPRTFTWYRAAALVAEILTSQFGGDTGGDSVQSKLSVAKGSRTATNATGDGTDSPRPKP